MKGWPFEDSLHRILTCWFFYMSIRYILGPRFWGQLSPYAFFFWTPQSFFLPCFIWCLNHVTTPQLFGFLICSSVIFYGLWWLNPYNLVDSFWCSMILRGFLWVFYDFPMVKIWFPMVFYDFLMLKIPRTSWWLPSHHLARTALWSWTERAKRSGSRTPRGLGPGSCTLTHG